MNRRGQLVGLSFVVAAILVAVVAGSGALGGDDPAADASVTDGVRGVAETTALYRGIPQEGMLLGRADAPATIVEFVDVKCPACRRFVLSDGRDVVSRLVRTGRANLELRVVGLPMFRPDTLVGRTAVHAQAARGHAFELAELLFYNQGDEADAWVTAAEIGRIASRSPELRGLAEPTVATLETRRLAIETDRLAQQLGVKATPKVFVRPRGTVGPDAYVRVDLGGTGSRTTKIANAVDGAAPAARVRDRRGSTGAATISGR